jgi:hypothetical protein
VPPLSTFTVNDGANLWTFRADGLVWTYYTDEARLAFTGICIARVRVGVPVGVALPTFTTGLEAGQIAPAEPAAFVQLGDDAEPVPVDVDAAVSSGRFGGAVVVDVAIQVEAAVSSGRFGGAVVVDVAIQVEAAVSSGRFGGAILVAQPITVEASVLSGRFGGEIPAFVVTSGTKSLVGSAGMAQIINASDDDNFVGINLPFSATVGGVVHSSIFIGSNSYLTWGSGSASYNNLSFNSTPPQPTLHLGSADNSYQRVYSFTDPTNRFVRARFEGNASTSGTPGFPVIVWEATIFNPSVNNGNLLIEVVTGIHNRATGLFGMGGSGVNVLNAAPLSANQSYVFSGDSTGANWTAQAGAYVAF